MMTDCPCLVRDLVEILRQGAALVQDVSDGAYIARPVQIEASSVGAHYRHHLEHVQLLLRGLDTDAVVDYDRRARDPRLEQCRAFALNETEALIDRLKTLTDEDLARTIRVTQRSCVAGDEAARPCSASTLGRELLFVLSHAVHHYALMNIVAQLLGQRPDQSIGVMPSTLVYLQGEQQKQTS